MDVVPSWWPQALQGWCLPPGLGANLLVIDSVWSRNIRTNLRQKEVPGSPLDIITCIYWVVQPKLNMLDAPGAALGKVTQVSPKKGVSPIQFCSCTAEHCSAHPGLLLKRLKMCKFGNTATWEQRGCHIQSCNRKCACTSPPGWLPAPTLP